MKLTAGQIYDAYLALASIINKTRNIPQSAKYKVARMYKAISEEGKLIDQQRNDIIDELGEVIDEHGLKQIHSSKMPDFLQRWKEISDVECEVNITPISINELGESGEIEAHEFLMLDKLVVD